ncbi:hypothetical protein Tco_0379325 [Tanacetum coccineum]
MENYGAGDMKKGFWLEVFANFEKEMGGLVEDTIPSLSNEKIRFVIKLLPEFETGYGHPFTMEACWGILKNREAWTEVEMHLFNQRPMDKKMTQSNPLTPEKPPMPPISSFSTIEKSVDEHEICDGYLTEKEQH